MNDLITVAEAAALSRLSPHYIRRLHITGRIKGESIEGHYYIDRSSLFEFLRRRNPIVNRTLEMPRFTHASSEKRQEEKKIMPAINDQIMSIENDFQGDVLVYMSQFGKNNSIIIPDDGMYIDDFLNGMDTKFPGHNKKFKKIILYISSPGGLLEASVKIIDIIKQYSDSFEVIIPYMAKSAASLICLSSDMINMTTISELGPIDPIIENPANPGQMMPARAIDDFIKYYSAVADSQGSLSNSLLKIFENKIDPYLLGSWKTALRYSQKEIEKALQGKIDNEKIQNVVSIFTTDEVSHSHPITYQNLEEMGFKNINQITGEKLNHVKILFTNFNDYMRTNKLVKIIGNRYQCFNIQETITEGK